MLPPAATRNFAATLGNLLSDPGNRSPDPGPNVIASRARKIHLFKRARDTIHQSLDDGVGVASVCARLGTSRRSLEFLFNSMLGTSPARYIYTLQLNAIRKELLAEEKPGRSIGDIAARWGVWHWSRFSRDYQRMFGELPSQTRRVRQRRSG